MYTETSSLQTVRLLRPQLIQIVLYSARDTVWKLTDFGLATEGSSRTNRPTPYSRGTSGYRASELMDSWGDLAMYNNKVDIWTMGFILYELSIGACPFK